MCCCCSVLHRHQIHLISYGCVSLGLITTGLVFTIFAIFQKESQIGKVWLAGPTTMVVGLVLCGKVIIDWGPAMMHAREGSIDSGQMYSNNPFGPMTDTLPSSTVQIEIEQEVLTNALDGKSTDSFSIPEFYQQHPASKFSTYHQTSPQSIKQPLLRQGNPMKTIDSSGSVRYNNNNFRQDNDPYRSNSSEEDLYRPRRSNPKQSLIYTNHNAKSQNGDIGRRMSSSVLVNSSPRLSSSQVGIYSKNPSCECSQYGSIWRTQPPFQGESFVLNERNYLI